MNTTANQTPEEKQIARFQNIKDRLKKVSETKIRIETQLSAAEEELKAISKKAEEEFKTSDINELKIRYKNTLDQNEAILTQAEQELTDAENIINQIIQATESN